MSKWTIENGQTGIVLLGEDVGYTLAIQDVGRIATAADQGISTLEHLEGWRCSAGQTGDTQLCEEMDALREHDDWDGLVAAYDAAVAKAQDED